LDPTVELEYPFNDLTILPGCEIKDSENGKLDLSTVLFNPQGGICDFKKSLKNKAGCTLYDDEDIRNGGEVRNFENIMISTASADVGGRYLELVEKYGEKKAYKKTLKYYHKQIEKAYEESFHLPFPEPDDGKVTNLHNLAVRAAGHDFLPAEIMFDGMPTSLFMIPPLEKKLDEDEKIQQSSPVDGAFDDVFTDIDNFCPSPAFCITVDLLAADQSFGKQFADEDLDLNVDTFDEFMAELEDGKFNKNDRVSKLLDEVFSSGLELDD
jgi:hypothetical protein